MCSLNVAMSGIALLIESCCTGRQRQRCLVARLAVPHLGDPDRIGVGRSRAPPRSSGSRAFRRCLRAVSTAAHSRLPGTAVILPINPYIRAFSLSMGLPVEIAAGRDDGRGDLRVRGRLVEEHLVSSSPPAPRSSLGRDGTRPPGKRITCWRMKFAAAVTARCSS